MILTHPSAIPPNRSGGLYYNPMTLRRRIAHSTIRQPPTASLNYFPTELLAYIFELGTHPGPSDPDVDSTEDDGSRFEIRVSHVNRRWRTVAIETKKLWTSIVFREMSHLERAEVYLQRSGSHTIDVLVDTISVKDHVRGVTLCREEFDRVFNIVVPEVRRWRSLILKVRDIVCKTGARKHLSTCGPAPMLETLQLYHFDEDWETSQELYIATVRPPVVIFEGVLPRLRNVFLIGVNLPWATSHFLCDLQELELALHSVGVRPTYAEWHRILTSSPHLRRLSLHYSGPLASDDWPAAPIALPHLSELALTDLDPDYLCRLFEHLSMPAVTRLRLELPDQDFTPFVRLLARGAAPVLRRLESLHVTALDCTADAWGALLAAAPALRFLHVDFHRVQEEFFAALVTLVPQAVPAPAPGPGKSKGARGARPALPLRALACPQLAALKVTGLSATALAELCRMRAAYGCALQRLYVNERERNNLLLGLAVACQVHWLPDPDDDDDDEDDEDDDDEGGEFEGTEAESGDAQGDGEDSDDD